MNNQNKKVKSPIIGADGNIFNILAIASTSLKEAGVDNEIIKEMTNQVFDSQSYDEALGIILEYIEPVEALSLEMDGMRFE